MFREEIKPERMPKTKPQKECEFCENLEFLKALHSENYKIINAYSVAIVVRSWTEAKGEDRAGRTTDYRDKGKGYQLNYCPECGRKIEEE